MTDQKPLELIIASDKEAERILKFDMELVQEITGVPLHAQRMYEDSLIGGWLDDGNEVPQNAVVYVHGNMSTKYENVGVVRGLAAERRDLRFVVGIDAIWNGEEYFDDPNDAQLVKERLEAVQQPQDQIVVTTELFFWDPTGGTDRWSYGSVFVGPYLKAVFPKIQAGEKPVPVAFKAPEYEPFDLVIAHHNPAGLFTLRGAAAEYVRFREILVPEETLETGCSSEANPYPQHAVVYVHGNRFANYENIGRVRRLAKVRPDLRFVIQADTGEMQKDASPDDYAFARKVSDPENQTQDNQIIVVREPFLAPKADDKYALEPRIDIYVKKRLRTRHENPAPVE